MEELLKQIVAVTKGPIPADIVSKLQDEEMTLEGFYLLEESDLRDLGFKLNARKLLLNWAKQEVSSQLDHTQSPVMSGVDGIHTPIHGPAITPSRSDVISTPARSDIISTPVRAPTSTAAAQSPQPLQANLYDVEAILCNYTKAVRGSDIVDKLKRGEYYSRDERVVLIKVLGKYLMKNCVTLNCPTTAEKTCMAKSVITAFPVLRKADLPCGYEEIYDAKAHTGHLEHFIRQKRSRDPFIQTHWSRKKRVLPLVDISNTTDDERLLREMRPTGSNTSELRDLMDRTRAARRQWIATEKPDATTILKRWPRFLDVNELIDDEFHDQFANYRVLRDAWPMVRQKIFDQAAAPRSCNAEIREAMASVADDFDEAHKTEVSFMLLPYLLVPPPRRGVKAARLGRSAVAKLLFVDFKDENLCVAEALQRLEQCKQPVLFRQNADYFVKVDCQAIHLRTAACFCDAVERLVQIFYVFHLEYPYELKPIYGLFEHLMQLPVSIGRSTCLSDFVGGLQL